MRALVCRRWGTPEQQARVADQTASWLQRHDFPAEEARLLFDTGAYVSDDLALRIAPIVADYARALETPLETSLAAIRVLKRARRPEFFPALEQRLTAQLASSISWSHDEMRLARQLARLADRWSDQKPKSALCEILIAMSAHARGRRLKTLMLKAALPLGSSEQSDVLCQAVRALSLHHDSEDVKKLQGHFNRRFGGGGSQ